MIEKIKYKGRDEWIELRRSGVGGSEAGIIMGISPYGSELTLWYDKIGAAEPKEANLAMKMGNHLEQLVADEFCERNGKRVREQHFMMRNSKYPFAIGNIDRRVVGENAILECKTTGSRPKMKQFRNGEYPDTWYCQCQHYIAVGNYKMAYLAVIYRNDAGDYEQWEIPRDDEFIELMMAEEEAFWDKVVNRVRPDPKGHPDENGIINAMSPAKNDMKAQIGMLRDALNKYEEYGELEKQYHQLREEQKNIICAAMGSATDGYIGDEKVCTWREQHKKSYVVSESTSRVFRIYHDVKKGKKT